jgi:gamma-glutamylcyclotransferase (GGCT)/AIG2-like uncharacterized protein YtfP
MTENEKIIEQAKADMLPYESWERLAGESSAAFAAFCAFRDLGAERNVRKAVESVEKDEAVRAKRYKVWRNWCAQFRWRERAADYDGYTEKLKQAEMRKTIEAQGEMHRRVTGKMLAVVEKKLDLMDAVELTQGNLTEWVQTAIKADQEAWQLTDANCPEQDGENGKPEMKQGELNFVSDFNGL